MTSSETTKPSGRQVVACRVGEHVTRREGDEATHFTHWFVADS